MPPNRWRLVPPRCRPILGALVLRGDEREARDARDLPSPVAPPFPQASLGWSALGRSPARALGRNLCADGASREWESESQFPPIRDDRCCLGRHRETRAGTGGFRAPSRDRPSRVLSNTAWLPQFRRIGERDSRRRPRTRSLFACSRLGHDLASELLMAHFAAAGVDQDVAFPIVLVVERLRPARVRDQKKRVESRPRDHPTGRTEVVGVEVEGTSDLLPRLDASRYECGRDRFRHPRARSCALLPMPSRSERGAGQTVSHFRYQQHPLSLRSEAS